MRKGQLVRIRKESRLLQDSQLATLPLGRITCIYNSTVIGQLIDKRIDVQLASGIVLWGCSAGEFVEVNESPESQVA